MGQIAGVEDTMRALAIAFTLGAVSALPLSSLHSGLGVGHGHHFEQGVREDDYHNVQSHHQHGGLHHVEYHHQGLHHDVGHPDRHVHRLNSRHYLGIGSHYGKRNTAEEEPPEQIQQVGDTSSEKTDQVGERATHLGLGGHGIGFGLGSYGPYGLHYGLGYHGGYAGYGPYGMWKRSVHLDGSRSKRSPKPFGFGYGLGYGGYGLGFGGLGGYGLGYGLYGHGLYGTHYWKRSSEDSSSKSVKVRAKRSPSPYYGFGLGPYYGFGYGLGGLYGGYGLYGHGFWRRSTDENEADEVKGKVKRSAEPFYGYHGYHDHHHHHHYPYHGYGYGW